MCNFFSFVTNPDVSNDFYYFDWKMRQVELKKLRSGVIDCSGEDSHSHICAHFKLDEDRCNKYEYDPLTQNFEIDMQNAKKDDRRRAKKWVEGLDWKMIVEPLIVKSIVNPFELPKVEKPTDEQVGLLKEWASVVASVWASVGDSVWASVRDSVRASVGASVWASVVASVWDSVWDSVGDSVWDSVRDSVRASVGDSVGDAVLANVGSFFDIKYLQDYSSAVKLWESGLVSSFDGETWRLHSGISADVVYEWVPVATGD